MVRTIDTTKARSGYGQGQPARDLQHRIRSGYNHGIFIKMDFDENYKIVTLTEKLKPQNKDFKTKK